MSDEKGRWVTIKSTPVFIKYGETLSQALKRTKAHNIKEARAYEEKLTRENISIKGFDTYSDTFKLKQYKAIDEQLKNDKYLKNFINKYGLEISTTKMPKGSGGRTYTGVYEPERLQIELNKDLEKDRNTINKYRESGYFVDGFKSNIKDEQYTLIHEIGHLKWQMMCLNFIKKKNYFEKIDNKIKEFASSSQTQNQFIRKCTLLKEAMTIKMLEEYGVNNYKSLGISKYAEKSAMETIAEYNLIRSNSKEYNKISELEKMFEELEK